MLVRTAAVLSAVLCAAGAQDQGGAARMPAVVADYFAGLQDLELRYSQPMSTQRDLRLLGWLEERAEEFAKVDPTNLARDEAIDLWLLRADVQHRDDELVRQRVQRKRLLPMLTHAWPLVEALEAHGHMEPVDAEAAAAMLHDAKKAIELAEVSLKEGAFDAFSPPDARAAADLLASLHRSLSGWRTFHDGYDPAFSWWTRAPWQRYDEAQGRFVAALRQRLVDGKAGDASLVGEPIGEEGLLAHLAHEFVPYTPTELVAIAEREFAWCRAEAKRASEDLGCGGDWKKALELVKSRHRAPGQQPQLIRELADEAIAFLEQRDLVTIPPLAKECWRMAMMSPSAQRVNPFFLGGRTIQISFPTDAMQHEEKLQSLRSNNEHFCRATVHHELIPGHWLQQYATARHRTWRAGFETPFWIEGWALYWEMRLYDLGFAHGPEDRVGMLYWRMHRCARIVFSLNYHLGKWSPRECIDYLVKEVGHEPAAAEAEVRRSVNGGYSPLYQAAYMLGGLQLRALHGELVASGAMTERAFHDAVLQQNAIPIALLRAALQKEPPTEESVRRWRFADAK